MPDFPERLKQLRAEKNIMQKDLAELLDLTPRAMRKYETGEIDPPTSKIIILAKYFGVSVDYLLGLTDNLESK